MGLLDKIEDKLSGNKDSNKLEKQGYDSNTGSTGTSSKLQHPISNSSGGTYGTSTGNTSGQDYDRYQQDNSGYTSSMKDRVPGSHVTRDESHIPSSNTTSSRVEPRQAYDPYSSKGQETAARGAGGYGSSHDREGEHYGVTQREDPSLARSKDGGILNHSSDHRHGDQRHGDQRYEDERYGTQQTSSANPTSGQHHYGRDAAMAGGAGAAGYGAYEMGKDHSSSQPLTANRGQQQYDDSSYRQQQQPQHNVQQVQHSTRDGSMGGGGMEPPAMGGSQQGQMSGESPGLNQARKMGGAYEAGYKDAMKHMQEEMAQKGQGSGY